MYISYTLYTYINTSRQHSAKVLRCGGGGGGGEGLKGTFAYPVNQKLLFEQKDCVIMLSKVGRNGYFVFFVRADVCALSFLLLLLLLFKLINEAAACLPARPPILSYGRRKNKNGSTRPSQPRLYIRSVWDVYNAVRLWSSPVLLAFDVRLPPTFQKTDTRLTRSAAARAKKRQPTALGIINALR